MYGRTRKGGGAIGNRISPEDYDWAKFLLACRRNKLGAFLRTGINTLLPPSSYKFIMGKVELEGGSPERGWAETPT